MLLKDRFFLYCVAEKQYFTIEVFVSREGEGKDAWKTHCVMCVTKAGRDVDAD
ncbi:hypothetical protein PcaKH16_19550 [Parageobacillus caldoxylosilyticus]|nr:hypothetical protein PcaKH16_19550 [Parageobacillus caldoxylosilyticus]